MSIASPTTPGARIRCCATTSCGTTGPWTSPRWTPPPGPWSGSTIYEAYAKKREGATTIREILDFGVRRGADGIVEIEVRADAFCHNQVRSMVGALLFVGDGHRGAEWPRKVLDARVRDSAVHVVRPLGLTLEEVAYPADDQLAERQRQARRVRGAVH